MSEKLPNLYIDPTGLHWIKTMLATSAGYISSKRQLPDDELYVPAQKIREFVNVATNDFESEEYESKWILHNLIESLEQLIDEAK